MRSILFLKKLDLALQLAGLLPIFFGWTLLSYCIVGTVQVFSWLFNAMSFEPAYKHRYRKTYGFILLILAVTFFAILLFSAGGLGSIVVCMLMAVSPFIAVFYFLISYKEMRLIKGICMRDKFTRI